MNLWTYTLLNPTTVKDYHSLSYSSEYSLEKNTHWY